MKETILTQEIFKTLDYARARSACVLIQGKTGRGKTEAVKAWTKRKKDSLYIDCPAEGGRPAIAQALMDATGASSATALEKFFAARKATVVLDECARLIPDRNRGGKATALEYLRRLHDEAGVALCFIATDFFIKSCTAGSVGEYLEQFIGRFRDKLIIPDYVSLAESKDILESIINDPSEDAIRWASYIANERGKGGARRLWWLLEDAADIAKQTKHEITVDFLRAVLKDYEGRQRLPDKE